MEIFAKFFAFLYALKHFKCFSLLPVNSFILGYLAGSMFFALLLGLVTGQTGYQTEFMDQVLTLMSLPRCAW